MAAPATTAEVLVVHERLTRYVHGHFRRKLTFEEARDVAAEALAEADRAVEGGLRILDLERWLRRAAWRNALDAVRHIEGEGARPRERPVDLADHVEHLSAIPGADAPLLDDDERAVDARALARAWAQLKPDEQRALHLRYFDELDVPEVMAMLDCSRHHYENLVKRALRKLRQALVTETGSDACREARGLVLQADLGLLPPALAARRDAHLDSCLACRAFGRRQRGLIAALPLPAAGLLDKIIARVHGHATSAADLPHQGEAVVGSVALSGAGAAADVHHWISEVLGRRPQDAQTLSRWWERFRSQTEPPPPAALFLAGRQPEAEQLTGVLRGAPTVVTVQAGWRDDALAFVQQVVAGINEAGEVDEPLTIASAEVWDRVIERPGHMTLIPLFEGPDVATALEHGHHVVLVAGRDAHVRGTKIELPRPHRQEATEALRAAGVEYDAAYRLAGLARRSVPALVRDLARDSRFSKPAWAQLPPASIFAPAMLAGAWTSSEADHSVVARGVGQDWAEIERVLNYWQSTDDAPFVKSGQQNWRLASPEEAFLVLGSQLTTRDLETWRPLAVEILLELDPRLDLAADQRPMAGLLEIRRRYSGVLRQGVAQSLALLGWLDDQVVGNAGPASDHAAWVVREILGKAAEDDSGRTWQSLSDVLPLIAEASPRVFLDAVHSDLDRESPLLAFMYQDRAEDPWFSTSSPHTGLLWALEGLCWSPEWLLEAAHALALLNQIDPGGRLANRPLESLSSIFPHWIRHTGAPLETRIDALWLIARRGPNTAWKLARRIWPSHHATSSPPHAPRFRDWKPESQSILISEALEYIGEVVSLALSLADNDSERWADLAEHMAPLPPGDRERVLAFLESKAGVELDDPQRLALWHRLHTAIARHRRFASAEWSMDEETLKRLEAIAAQLEPTGQVARHAYLFDWRPDLPGFGDDHAAYDEELKRLREAAVRETLEDSSLAGLRDLAKRSRAAHQLGAVVADEADDSLSASLIQWLDSDDPKLREVASAWAAQRAYTRGVTWVIDMLATPEASTPERRRGLVLAAQPTEELWTAVGDADPSLLDEYWTMVNPWRVASDDVDRAARELMARDRPWAAIDLLASSLHGRQDTTAR